MLVYLRFVLKPEADREGFERDLASMQELARRQPGFHWSEVGGGSFDERTYLVVSEWEDVEQVRAYEHHPEHQAVMERWEEQYAETFQHRRFVPWIPPGPAP